MSQAESQPRPSPKCWDCGAENDASAAECWLCQRRDWRGPAPSLFRPKGEASSDFNQATALVGLTLGLVALGAVAIAPGLVIGLLILVAPAWIGAEIIANRRRNRGMTTSTTRKVMWIVVLAILLPVAMFIAFMMVCMAVNLPNMH
jgi:hypothetical protein